MPDDSYLRRLPPLSNPTAPPVYRVGLPGGTGWPSPALVSVGHAAGWPTPAAWEAEFFDAAPPGPPAFRPAWAAGANAVVGGGC